MPESIDFQIDRNDLLRTRFFSRTLEPGEDATLVRVQRFALSANNVTYAIMGGAIMGGTTGYSDFFPAEAGWGRIPAWGFGEVMAPGRSGLGAGERLFGYFPMSSDVALRPAKLAETGFYDGSAHRAHLSPIYNYYSRTAFSDAYDPAREREDMLLRPLFYASFLVHDLIADEAGPEAESVVVTSASSKAAIGLAHMLWAATPRRREIIGLTSDRNLEFVKSLGIYDRVRSYGDLDALKAGTTIIADFSGDARLIDGLRGRLAERVRLCCLVGTTHWQQASAQSTADVALVRFFSPDRMRKRVREWGRTEFDRRFHEAFLGFVRFSRGWLRIVESAGPESVERIYGEIARNGGTPEEGHIVSLWT